MIQKIMDFSNDSLSRMISILNKERGLSLQFHPDYPGVTMESWYENLVSEYESRNLTPDWHKL